MSHDWIIDVLKDLRKFSVKNGMTDLTEQLDDTIQVAAEVTLLHGNTVGGDPYGKENGGVSRPRGTL